MSSNFVPSGNSRVVSLNTAGDGFQNSGEEAAVSNGYEPGWDQDPRRVAHIRQSRQDSGLGVQIKVLTTLGR